MFDIIVVGGGKIGTTLIANLVAEEMAETIYWAYEATASIEL